jgi:hypothetical protein
MANTFLTATFRAVGNTLTIQGLLAINNTSTNITMTLRRMLMHTEQTAVITTPMWVRMYRTTAANTGGTQITSGLRVPFDSAYTSSTLINILQAASADGTNTAITPNTLGNMMWQTFVMRIHTQVGQIIPADHDLIPILCADNSLAGLTIKPSEYVVVQLMTTTTAANPNTNHYLLSCVWEEV